MNLTVTHVVYKVEAKSYPISSFISTYFAIINKKIDKETDMLITRASEYAILSLIVLSKSPTAMDSETLANQLFIPKSFLAKILQSLAKSGILKSFKGANGGFALLLEPKEITMLSIVTCVEGKTPAVFDCAASMHSCPSGKAAICSLWPFLNKLQGKIDTLLQELTLADILE